MQTTQFRVFSLQGGGAGELIHHLSQSLAEGCSGSIHSMTLLICPTHGQEDPGGRRNPSGIETLRLAEGLRAQRGVGGHS